MSQSQETILKLDSASTKEEIEKEILLLEYKEKLNQSNKKIFFFKTIFQSIVGILVLGAAYNFIFDRIIQVNKYDSDMVKFIAEKTVKLEKLRNEELEIEFGIRQRKLSENEIKLKENLIKLAQSAEAINEFRENNRKLNKKYQEQEKKYNELSSAVQKFIPKITKIIQPKSGLSLAQTDSITNQFEKILKSIIGLSSSQEVIVNNSEFINESYDYNALKSTKIVVYTPKGKDNRFTTYLKSIKLKPILRNNERAEYKAVVTYFDFNSKIEVDVIKSIANQQFGFELGDSFIAIDHLPNYEFSNEQAILIYF